jgi:hypothetical protein
MMAVGTIQSMGIRCVMVCAPRSVGKGKKFRRRSRQFAVCRAPPRSTTGSTLHKWRRALEAAGVIFIDLGAKSDEGCAGVRLRSAKEKR